MQATTVAPAPAPAKAPAPPAAVPAGGEPTITFTGVDGTQHVLPVPRTAQAISDLRAQREELSNQLTSAASRRKNLAAQLTSTPAGPARSGLEQRIMVLDQRMVQLESDIAATGKQLSEAPLSLTSTPFQGGDIPDNVAAITGAFTFLVLFPMALAMARRIWKRGSYPPAPQQQISPQIDQRLERLEQGVDAIAIEIERITEGQRFVTRLLSESQASLKLPEEKVALNRD
jgi:hypothetical protein